MRHLVLSAFFIITAVATFVGVAPASSTVYGYTSVDYDSATDTVTAYSYTTHPLGGNYEPYVTTTIYDEDDNWIADDTFQQTEGGPATVTVHATGHGCQYYHAVTWHAVDAYYYVTEYFQPATGFYEDGYYDPNNFGQPDVSPLGFSPSKTFTGPGPIRIRLDEMIGLGQTEVVGFGNCSPSPQVTIGTIGSVEKGGSKSVTVTAHHLGSHQITLYLMKSNNASTNGVTFADGSSSRIMSSNNETVVLKGVATSDQTEDYKIEARYTEGNTSFLPANQDFTVSSVAWGENSACSGFDNDYLFVPKAGTNKVNAYIIPSGATGNFKLDVASSPTNNLSISPTTVSTNNTEVTVSGGATAGNFIVNVSANQQNATSLDPLNVYVRDRINKTLVFYAVTESATNTPPPGSNVPTASGLQTYLNETWGKQANVYFAVTKGSDFGVAYDIDQDGRIDSGGARGEPNAVMNASHDPSKDFNVYFLGMNVKPVTVNGSTVTPAAFTYPLSAVTFVGPTYDGTRDYITGHEVGHLLLASGRTAARETSFLMYEHDQSASPCKVGKSEWDVVNPYP